MGDVILSLYDLTGIQGYVFASNVLRENIGGSFLVSQALGEWLIRASAEVSAKVLWSGGGNAMVRSDTMQHACRVATLLSKKLREEAPGLGLACAHACWDGRDESYARTLSEAREQLLRHKAGAWPDAGFDGAGVTAACRSTSEPAVQLDSRDERQWLGPGAQARLAATKQAEGDLQSKCEFDLDQFTDAQGKSHELTWTAQQDDLGRSRGELSFLGVIHFDGNSMGRRFERAAKDSPATHALLSTQVKIAGRQTLRVGLSWVLDRLAGITNTNRGGFGLHKQGEALCFPVRPIVYGGDDITLVCDARIALDLAAELLRAWNEVTKALDRGPAHACAGVALVKAHYPFHRAYRLSEELCRSAKDWLQGKKLDHASALDPSVCASDRRPPASRAASRQVRMSRSRPPRHSRHRPGRRRPPPPPRAVCPEPRPAPAKPRETAPA